MQVVLADAWARPAGRQRRPCGEHASWLGWKRRVSLATCRRFAAMGYRRICKTSLTGRRGVGDGGDSVCGMVPTRINAAALRAAQ